jgi:hypothetical protein
MMAEKEATAVEEKKAEVEEGVVVLEKAKQEVQQKDCTFVEQIQELSLDAKLRVRANQCYRNVVRCSKCSKAPCAQTQYLGCTTQQSVHVH